MPDQSPDVQYRQALPAGYQLHSYRVKKVLGVGGFGVTYLAEHTRLGHNVALKEYMPNEFAVREGTTVHPKSRTDKDDFQWGLTRFLDEAKILIQFKHPNLVRVMDYFDANNTAYFAMEYEVGEPLDQVLRRRGRLTEPQLRHLLLPIVDGLKMVHRAGYLHRDIKPANIFIRRKDESPVLLDFGAARLAMGQKSKSMTAIASAGHSPPEQYESDGNQGAWSDIYSLSAVCYSAITGEIPVEAPRRLISVVRNAPDPLPKLVDRFEDYSQSFLNAIDVGLSIVEDNRPQNLDQWLRLLNGEAAGGDSRRPRQPRAVASPAAGSPPAMAAPREPKKATASGRKRMSRVVAGAVGVAVVALLVALGLNERIPWPMRTATPQQFAVVATPAGATVALTELRSGESGPPRTISTLPALLSAGDYALTVSAPGYKTLEMTVRHSHRPTTHRVALAPNDRNFTVLTRPATAAVAIWGASGDNRGKSYDNGAPMPAGRYRVAVSASGYGKYDEEVLHGTTATRHHVALMRSSRPR